MTRPRIADGPDSATRVNAKTRLRQSGILPFAAPVQAFARYDVPVKKSTTWDSPTRLT